MSSTEYRFDGLDALERRLAQLIERQYPAEFRERSEERRVGKECYS